MQVDNYQAYVYMSFGQTPALIDEFTIARRYTSLSTTVVTLPVVGSILSGGVTGRVVIFGVRWVPNWNPIISSNSLVNPAK